MTPQPSDWRRLAEQLQNEADPNRLMELAVELNRVLEHEQKSHQKRYQTSEGR